MIVGSSALCYIYLPLARIRTVAAIPWQKRLYAEFSLHVVIWSIGDYPGPQAWIFRISSFGFKGHQDTFLLSGNGFTKAYYGKLVDRGPSVLVLSKYQDIVHDSDDRPWLVRVTACRPRAASPSKPADGWPGNAAHSHLKSFYFATGYFEIAACASALSLSIVAASFSQGTDFSFPYNFLEFIFLKFTDFLSICTLAVLDSYYFGQQDQTFSLCYIFCLAHPSPRNTNINRDSDCAGYIFLWSIACTNLLAGKHHQFVPSRAQRPKPSRYKQGSDCSFPTT